MLRQPFLEQYNRLLIPNIPKRSIEYVAALTTSPGVRTHSHKELPPSVETAYYRKCIELRRRINDIEENNDATRLRTKRLNRAIMKMRLERAFLLEQLHKHMEFNIDDSDRSSSPPPTPTDKPLRSKRGHRQKTPPTGAGGAQQASPGALQHQSLMHAMNPMSSAQSTPDPGRSAPFFSSVAPPASSPHATANGTSGLPQIAPLSALQSQRSQETPSRSTYYDPPHDEPRPTEDEAKSNGRQRTNSGTQPPPSETQNGDSKDQEQDPDTEMQDAAGGGFTAVNRH